EDRLALDRPDLRPLLQQLRQARAGLARLTGNLPTPAGQKAWRERFEELEKEKESAEVKLAQASTAFRRLRQRRHLTAAEVARALPARPALVDLIEYTHGTPDPAKKGKWQWERRLLAFILLPGRDPARVPLGPALPVSRAVEAWRKPITADRVGSVDAAAA